uniref:DUF3606 domain-containing protein n=1 Tax=uncultured bacterium 162 TaxID=698381 RepID=E3T764_9BACT|nr:hypothetical protein [uncultured bacterium 162]
MGIKPTDFDTLPTLDADTPKAPHDPEHINPKLASDVRYWAAQFGVSGQVLHEAVRVHGTSVAKVRAAIEQNRVNMTNADDEADAAKNA